MLRKLNGFYISLNQTALGRAILRTGRVVAATIIAAGITAAVNQIVATPEYQQVPMLVPVLTAILLGLDKLVRDSGWFSS